MAAPKAVRVKTGIRGLDDVVDGGLPANRMYLVQGDPGVGKTTIGLQFLLDGAAAGERGLYVTLSETAEELSAVAHSHGWDLGGITVHEVMPSTSLLLAEDDSTLFQPSEIELGETTRAILFEIERIGASRVVIDSLSEIRLLSQSALRYRRQILALKHFFAGKHITVLLLDDGTSEAGDIHLQSIAHGVIRVEQLAPLYGAERRRLRVVKLRGVNFRGGFHDMKIETGRVVVFPRLVAAEHLGDFPLDSASSGVPALDALLGGGLDRGTTNLIMGPAGTGKSAIAAQYATAAGDRGEAVHLFTFEEGLGTLFKRTQLLGIPLRRCVDEGRIVVQQVNPAELTPGEFAALVRTRVEQSSARVIVIDSINGYFSSMPEENFLMLQLHELFTYLRQRGVVVILTLAQHGLIGHMASPIDLSYLADTVVLLRYFEAGGEIRKAISVPKKRSGRHEQSIRELAMDGGGIRLGPPLSNFRGILTGTPEYLGGSRPSRAERDDAAGV
jgi:circadian clock protein KaiC